MSERSQDAVVSAHNLFVNPSPRDKAAEYQRNYYLKRCAENPAWKRARAQKSREYRARKKLWGRAL